MTTTTSKRKGTIVDPNSVVEPAEPAMQFDVSPPAINTDPAVAVDAPDADEEEDDDDYVGVEDMADDEELYPGGPLGRELKEWKNRFGEIYVTSFDADLHVVWRTLNRFEYRNLVQSLEQSIASGAVSQAVANLNNEEAICERCVLHPQMSRTDTTSIPAGVASIISQEVMEASAFVPLEVRRL